MTTTTTKKSAMMKRIERHGLQLLAIFPNATERDPVKLCKALRRLESQMHVLAEMQCNGDITGTVFEDKGYPIGKKIRAILGDTSNRVWMNNDPRGYALKIDLQPGEELHRDMGGYGIVAPDLA